MIDDDALIQATLPHWHWCVTFSLAVHVNIPCAVHHWHPIFTKQNRVKQDMGKCSCNVFHCTINDPDAPAMSVMA